MPSSSQMVITSKEKYCPKCEYERTFLALSEIEHKFLKQCDSNSEVEQILIHPFTIVQGVWKCEVAVKLHNLVGSFCVFSLCVIEHMEKKKECGCTYLYLCSYFFLKRGKRFLFIRPPIILWELLTRTKLAEMPACF